MALGFLPINPLPRVDWFDDTLHIEGWLGDDFVRYFSKTATLVDLFTVDALGTNWPNHFGGCTVSGGVATVPCGTGYAALTSDPKYSILGSSVSAKLTPPSAGTSTTEAFVELQISGATAGTDLTCTINTVAGILYLQSRSGYYDGARTELTYSPTNHAYVKMSESLGTLTWWTSADGVTWDPQRTAAAPPWLVSDVQTIVITAHRNDGSGTDAIVDDFNKPLASPFDCTVWNGSEEINAYVTVWNGTAEIDASVTVN